MHIHNCCANDGEYLILLIKTGNAHKQRIMLQTIINTFKKYKGRGIETHSKMMMTAKCL